MAEKRGGNMRKIIIGLILSVVMFLSGICVFVYECNQLQENSVDINQARQTNTFQTKEDINLYTVTYLDYIGEVNVIVNMVEDETMNENDIQITYPSMLSLERIQESKFLALDFENQEYDNSLEKISQIWNKKQYTTYYARNNEIKVTIKFGKNLKDKIHLVNNYYVD